MTTIAQRPSERSVGRVPPHSKEAEESVLGAILLSSDAANQVMDKVAPEDFYLPAHQAIFEAVVHLYNANQPIDAVTVSEELRRSGRLERIGGVAYLTSLVDMVPAASNVDYYADIVVEHSLRRNLIRAGSTVTDLAFRTEDEVVQVIDRAEQEVLGVAERRAGESMIAVGPLFQSAIEQIETMEALGSEITGLATGFRDLDKKLAGLQPANLVVVAARPSMGKCLVGSTHLVDGKTGELVTIKELVENPDQQDLFHTLSYDADRKELVASAPTAFIDNGIRDVFALTTDCGRRIVATGNHPLLTHAGWRLLSELMPGEPVAVPAKPEAGATIAWDAIHRIEPAGRERVYDLTVPIHENFVANDVVVHNSSLALNIATNVAASGKTVAIFSLEMSKEEIVQRILCSVGRVDSMKLRTGQLNSNMWERVVAAASRMFKAPIFIDDSSVVTVTDIRAKCRRLKRAHSLDLVMVDYLQLMQGTSRENRQQEIAEISRGLKGLARELDVPIIGVSQLNRALEAREDKRPRLADLRESGSIEQDSDVVMFIYRHEYYHPDDVDKKGMAEVMIAKHRAGATGMVEMTFLPDFTRFADLGRDVS